MLTVYNAYRMQQSDVMQAPHSSVLSSIMYSIDKCAGIPDLSKLAAFPKREGGGGKQSAMRILYVHHHKCRHHMGYTETKCTPQKGKAMGVVPSLITVGKTSPAFCCGQLLRHSKERENCK